MGVMAKMRESTKFVLYALVVAFGLIFMLQDTQVFDVIGSTGQVVGKVNGEDIPYDVYQANLTNRIAAYERQTGATLPTQLRDAEADRLFQELIDDKLRQMEMDRLGITVSDDEIRELITGNDPYPLIKQYFQGSDGELDRTFLQNFIADPNNAETLIGIEQYVRQERRKEKFDNLMNTAVRVTDAEAREDYVASNKKMNVSYVAFRYAAVPDSLITYGDSDLRAYYNNNKSDYARNKSYTIDYVTIPKVPSPEDSSSVREELMQLIQPFTETDEDSVFLARNFSTKPLTDAFFGPGDLADEISGAVFGDVTVGRVIGPVIAGEEIHVLKITDRQRADEPAVRARHILFSAAEGNESLRQSAKATADGVMTQLRAGESFASLAQQLSADTGSGERGGDLGWFGRGTMVAPFEDAAFSASVGQLIGPVATRFGYHIIEVTDRTNWEVQVADLARPLTASLATIQDIENRLDDIAVFAEESGSIREEVQRRNDSVPVQTAEVEEGESFIPGIGNSRALINFVRNSKEGTISRVIELNDQFLVAQLTQVTEEGFRPFSEVRTEVEAKVKTAKKREYQHRKLEEGLAQGNQSLEDLSAAVGAPVQSLQNITLNSPVVGSLGREPKFLGTAYALTDGALSGVVDGTNSAFVIRLDDSAGVGDVTPADLEASRQKLLQVAQAEFRSKWLTDLRENANIVDNRDLFEQQAAN